MAQISATSSLTDLAALRPLTGFKRLAQIWADRQQSRSALSRLDPHLLRDIGLTAQNASIEAGKPFWRD